MVIGAHFGIGMDLATLCHKSERVLKRRPEPNQTMEVQCCHIVFPPRPWIVMSRPVCYRGAGYVFPRLCYNPRMVRSLALSRSVLPLPANRAWTSTGSP